MLRSEGNKRVDCYEKLRYYFAPTGLVTVGVSCYNYAVPDGQA
jgi:hypothetical protein